MVVFIDRFATEIADSEFFEDNAVRLTLVSLVFVKYRPSHYTVSNYSMCVFCVKAKTKEGRVRIRRVINRTIRELMIAKIPFEN